MFFLVPSSSTLLVSLNIFNLTLIPREYENKDGSFLLCPSILHSLRVDFTFAEEHIDIQSKGSVIDYASLM